MKILVVDDSPRILKVLRGFLRDEAHDLVATTSGVAALELLVGSDFDLLIADVVMPDMTGLELLEEVRDLYPDLGVMMISGHPSLEAATEALRLGAFDYLPKPFSREEIITAVRRFGILREVLTEKNRLELENRRFRSFLDQSAQEKVKEIADLGTELESSDSRWKAIVASLSDHVIVIDLDSRVRFINRPPAGMEIEAGALLSDCLPDEWKSIAEAVDEVSAGGPPEVLELGDEGRWYRVLVNPITASGDLELICCVFSEITDQKKIEAEKTRNRVNEAQLLVHELLAGVVPSLIQIFEPGTRSTDLTTHFGDRIEQAMRVRYFSGATRITLPEVSSEFSHFICDSGGEADVKGVQHEDQAEARIERCPWDNETRKEPALCRMCHVIAWRMARPVAPLVEVRYLSTRAEGAASCDIHFTLDSRITREISLPQVDE